MKKTKQRRQWNKSENRFSFFLFLLHYFEENEEGNPSDRKAKRTAEWIGALSKTTIETGTIPRSDVSVANFTNKRVV